MSDSIIVSSLELTSDKIFGWILDGFSYVLPYVKEKYFPIENYLTSPYFIVNIIMFIASTFFGFWFGRKRGKLLYSIIAFFIAFANLVSLGVNLF